MLFLSFPQVLYAKDPDSSKIYVTDEVEILVRYKGVKASEKMQIEVSKTVRQMLQCLLYQKDLIIQTLIIM